MMQSEVERERGDKVMDEAKLEGKVNDLVKEFGRIANLQYRRPACLAKQALHQGGAGQARNSHKQLEKSINRLQESLDYLRVCIKYQLFDLEATRRENIYLRKMLEEKNG